jgi:peptide deformylase
MNSILRLGNPRLRLVSTPVMDSDPQLQRDLKDLASALQSFRDHHHWGRAIAMPQIGIAKRAMAFDLRE